MIHTWRWYGPSDRITLPQIKQTGATGIVTALHHIANGQIWPLEDILQRKKDIEAHGLSWEVVESVPVHEDIKKQTGQYLQYIENYKESLRNLAKCGIKTVCYNFMPVLDWSRTDLKFQEHDGSLALKFEVAAFVAFDVYILQRPSAIDQYTTQQLDAAKRYFKTLDHSAVNQLTRNIIAGLPGSEESYTLDQFQEVLNSYKGINALRLKKHLAFFLKHIIPVAEQAGIKMAIHPDDPPMSLLGLPRIVSSLSDVNDIFAMAPSAANGLTFCTGSFGAGSFNDLSAMVKELAPKINFLHLRNVSRDGDGNFMERYFFEGDADMYTIVKSTLEEETRRGYAIPMRPDHGNQMLDDIGRDNNPGYSLYGRMKGLAEIRGLEYAIKRSLDN